MQSGGLGPPIPEALPAPPTWLVPIAISLWAVSAFLLLQGAAYLKWSTKDDDNAPDYRAGINLAWGLTIVIFFFFYLPLYFADLKLPWWKEEEETIRLFIEGLMLFPFKHPKAFAQALLFSSLSIGALAAFKFLIAASLMRSHATPSALTRSPLALSVAALFTFLQLAGSVASLIALFR